MDGSGHFDVDDDGMPLWSCCIYAWYPGLREGVGMAMENGGPRRQRERE